MDYMKILIEDFHAGKPIKTLQNMTAIVLSAGMQIPLFKMTKADLLCTTLLRNVEMTIWLNSCFLQTGMICSDSALRAPTSIIMDTEF